MTHEELRYGFGRNWDEFERTNLSERRIDIAQRSLLWFQHRSDLAGLRFLDIGCGSGIHSLAAYRSGAARVTSFDFDESSVATTRRLWEREGEPEHWTVGQGDVLNREFMEGLDEADVVYSWGVLHHTGEMWRAVRNAAIPLAPDGVFHIALYSSDVYVDPTPEFWVETKRAYNRGGWLRRRWLEGWYSTRFVFLPALRKGILPREVLRDYERSRGMAFYISVKDWLGGYPMEFAGNAETVAFGRDELGLEILDVDAGEGCTEFLFRRAGANGYWDDVWAEHPAVDLPGPFERGEGFEWSVNLSALPKPGDRALMLYEDGVAQGYRRERRKKVRTLGRGRFVREDHRLYFSTSDNSDPSSNGRVYQVRFGMGTLPEIEEDMK